MLAFRSLNTLTLLLLDHSRQFGLSRFMASKLSQFDARRRRNTQPTHVHNSKRLRGPTTVELLGNTAVFLLDTRQLVKSRAVPLEKPLDPVALADHKKKVYGATSSPAPPLPSASATSAWRPSLSGHIAGLPALRKQALKMKNGKATATWSVPAELHKFHLALADQLTIGQPIPLCMLWYCVLMCPTQDGDMVPCPLADGEVFIFPKPAGSVPDHMFHQLGLNAQASLWTLASLCPGHIRTLAVWFHRGRGGFPLLGDPIAIWERAFRAGWCISDCEGLRHAQQTTALPRHPSFGCLRCLYDRA